MKLHFTANYLLNPRHQVTVDLIGAGGTGSQMLQSLARIDYALYRLGHPGLKVRVWDSDIVTEANIGRQLFSPADLGLPKSEVLVTRINAFYGLSWTAQNKNYDGKDKFPYNITISCVDNVKSRIEIGTFLKEKMNKSYGYDENRPYYWMDFGNQTNTGQVVLGSIRKIKQPESEYQTVSHLKTITELFDLSKVKEEESGPSCSLAEALSKQDLFINSSLCQLGSSLLWNLFKRGCVSVNGLYLNLTTLMSSPIKL